MGLPARLLLPAALGAALSLTALAVPAYAAEAGMTSDRVFGYNIGALERDELITKVSATWNVPSATSHVPGESARSLAWVGLGGGACVTYDCRVQDDTAIQIGTEIRVDWLGIPTYHTWYRTASFQDTTDMELPITSGDRVRASVERVPGNPLLWKLSFRNLTTGASFSRTLPAASALVSARFVVESDVWTDEFGTGYPVLPEQDATRFDDISVNGKWARLRPEERVTFVPAMTEDVVGTASLPDAEGNGFTACAWATTCTL